MSPIGRLHLALGVTRCVTTPSSSNTATSISNMATTKNINHTNYATNIIATITSNNSIAIINNNNNSIATITSDDVLSLGLLRPHRPSGPAAIAAGTPAAQQQVLVLTLSVIVSMILIVLL